VRVAEAPEGFHGTLRPYQREGLGWLHFLREFSLGGCLADDMGLGKTVQVLALLAARRGVARHPSLVVVPRSLIFNWKEEAARFVPELRILDHTGLVRARAAEPLADTDLLLTTYGTLRRDVALLEGVRFDYVILDEAQNVKNHRTEAARAVRRLRADHRLALTGTPLENRLEEAYAIAQLIDQRLLPPLWQVDRDHFVRDPDGRVVVMYSNLGRIRSRLAPSFLRRTKEDVQLDLPERIRSVLTVPMEPLARKEHESVMDVVRQLLARKRILPADLDRVQKLLVIARRCCGGEHMLRGGEATGRAPKLVELEQLLRELALGEGRKVVVFSEWTDMTKEVERLSERLGLTHFHLHGGLPVRRRPALLKAFAEHEGPAVFVSTDAGGVGLNLQVADVVVSLDLPWNPARLEQRIARVHRIGSKGSVRVVLMVAESSVEARILALHATKQNVLDNVWAKDGEREIAAPGGSGAFKAVVEALLEQTASSRAVLQRRTAGDANEPAGAAGPASDGWDGDLEAIAEPLRSPAAAGAPGAAANGNGNGHTAAKAEAGAGGAVAAVAPRQTLVDPAALGQVVAGVLPSLPPEQRQALALVFRTLAEALA
jgi:SNF2 family DNA or RNA helicase